MKNDYKLTVVLHTVYNIITMLCFTSLAIMFDKWWIVLLAILLMRTERRQLVIGGYDRICDGCGKRSPVAKTKEESIQKAAKLGWVTVSIGENEMDYCPECRKKHWHKYGMTAKYTFVDESLPKEEE